MEEEERFESLVEAAKEVEGKAMDHIAYSGPLEITRVIDLSPDKYSGMNYDDLLNNCDRIAKVIKASKLDIYSAVSKETPKRAVDFEQQVKKITTESITTAEQMSRELEKEIKPPEKVEKTEFEMEFEIPEEKEPAKEEFTFEIERPEPKKKEEIKPEAEFENPEGMAPEKEVLEVEKAPEIVEPEIVEKPEVAEKAPEVAQKEEGKKELKPLQRALQRMRERKAGIVPPVLAAPEEPKNVFEEIKGTFDSEWSGEKDEEKIKRKMLELTKELFREKSSSKREEIKRQITVLKNMLAVPAEPKKGKVAKEEKYSSGLFSAVSGAMDSEFASKISAFSSGAEKQISAAKERFKNSLVDIPEDDAGARKGVLDKLMFELTGIGEQVDAKSGAFIEEILEKHIDMISQFEQSLTEKDKVSADKADEKKEGLKAKYEKEMELLKTSIHTRINAIIEESSRGLIVSERKETKKEKGKEEASNIINEIAEIDEGSLLFYLHAQDLNAYKSFEHKRISRQEAVNLARRIMAKEKGLNEEVINKHWGEI